MKLVPALGIALASLAVAAYAETGRAHFMFAHNVSETPMDADGDGWISRNEAAAAADRMFDALDTNNDRRLDEEDHSQRNIVVLRHGGEAPLAMLGDLEEEGCARTEENDGGQRRVTVICRDESEGGSERGERRVRIVTGPSETEIVEIEREVERAMAEAHRSAAEAERAARDAARATERRVIVVRGGPGEREAALAPLPPMPPMPPHPPMPMLLASSEEADLDGDGALSREEFRAQQLRFFDASDANNDGRIRAVLPPAPPAAPEAPRPPARD